ncbi:isoprenoid biosynthesis enzyme family protein [Streptomyces yaizuensis]|uniref:Trichodiene synthase n=1 Tax=Streptomyces yaizuensis TaxID=2989713 RepID=A0ABQ5NX76_9ACTN|nr:hypothetical protein [Streptomyces sp. YSPA8]GLF94954.1 hypothetical protein SYYSPA8_11675 [Streptomyces sp. YSPA8]
MGLNSARPAGEVPDSGHRTLVESVLEAGLLEPLLAEVRRFEPRFDRAQGERNLAVVTRELEEAGLPCPPGTARDLVTMQQLILPTEDDALSLALARTHVFVTAFDNMCNEDGALTRAVLAGLGTTPTHSPHAAYMERTLRAFEPFCDPVFLGVHRGFLIEALVGVLFEAEFAPDADDAIDTDGVRIRSGYNAFWSGMIQFLHPGLDFCRNTSFWAHVLPWTSLYLADMNDALSFYKESLDEREFTTSAIYREAVRRRIPYTESYRRTLERALLSRRRALACADDTQRPYLATYMNGYVYWHLRVERYRWSDLVPELTPVTFLR